MAVSYSFQNRFSYPQPSGITPSIGVEEIDQLSEEELEQIAPDLAEMAQMVRQYSVLLNRTTTADIFKIITRQADPQIAARLSAAKDKNTNTSLFKGLEAVQTVMFNDPSRVTGSTNNYLNSQLFSDGIRRVSAALTAAILLGRLPEVQREYAKELRDNAYEDLSIIVETYVLSSQSTGQIEDDRKEDAPVCFYFEPIDFNIPEEEILSLEWYCPSITLNWITVQQYTGLTSTWHLVSDLADAINQYTSQDPEATLLATAELNSIKNTGVNYHTLSFYPRYSVSGIIAHSINVRIQSRTKSTPVKSNLVLGETQHNLINSNYGMTPFKWGTTLSGIASYPVNGSIVVVAAAKTATTASLNIDDEEYTPTVVYFRNKQNYQLVVDPETSISSISPATPPVDTLSFKYRIQPWQPNLSNINKEQEEISEDFIRQRDYESIVNQIELDNSRYSQIAVQLMNGLARINLKTKTSGCVIRNDPTYSLEPMSALELIAWGMSKSISYVILDILEIPEDIEVATGDIVKPRTSFSNRPRSIRVPVKNPNYLSGVHDINSPQEEIKVVNKKRFQPWQDILDEESRVQHFTIR